MKVRKAKKEDVDKIFKLAEGAKELGYYDEDDLSRAYLEKVMSSDVSHVFVCEVAKEIIGFLHADESHGWIYLEELFVHNDFRRKGVGRILMMELEKLGEKKDISLFTGVKNNSAKKFYEKMGYKKGRDFTFYYKLTK